MWHAAQCVLCPRHVAGIEPLLDGQQRQAIPLNANGVAREADVGARGFSVLAIFGKPFGSPFAAASQSAETGRFATRQYQRRDQQGDGACQ